MKILSTPVSLTGESWLGYILRLAEANEFSGINAIAQILKLTNYQLVTRSPTGVLLRLNVNCTHLSGLNFPTDQSDPGRIRLGVFGRSIYSRVCAKCLRSDLIPYSRSDWDLALQVYCSTHQCVLIDECPQCSKYLDYLRPSIARCRCGYDLRLCKTKPASNLYSTIRSTFELDETNSPGLNTFTASSSRERDALAVVLRLMAQKGPRPALGRRASKINNSQAFVRARELDSLADWFNDWPNGFIQQLTHSKKLQGESKAVKLNSTTLMASVFLNIRQALIDAVEKVSTGG